MRCVEGGGDGGGGGDGFPSCGGAWRAVAAMVAEKVTLLSSPRIPLGGVPVVAKGQQCQKMLSIHIWPLKLNSSGIMNWLRTIW